MRKIIIYTILKTTTSQLRIYHNVDEVDQESSQSKLSATLDEQVRSKFFDRRSSPRPLITPKRAAGRRGCKYEEVINVSRHRLIISCQRIFEDHSGRRPGGGGWYNGRATRRRAQTRDPNRSRINTGRATVQHFPANEICFSCGCILLDDPSPRS